MLHNAPILLLDEPTSAMDFSTEAQITAAPRASFAQDKTVVLVTHRTSMLALVDRVIVIDGGRIVADGPRDRIMEALASGRVARARMSDADRRHAGCSGCGRSRRAGAPRRGSSRTMRRRPAQPVEATEADAVMFALEADDADRAQQMRRAPSCARGRGRCC